MESDSNSTDRVVLVTRRAVNRTATIGTAANATLRKSAVGSYGFPDRCLRRKASIADSESRPVSFYKRKPGACQRGHQVLASYESANRATSEMANRRYAEISLNWLDPGGAAGL